MYDRVRQSVFGPYVRLQMIRGRVPARKGQNELGGGGWTKQVSAATPLAPTLYLLHLPYMTQHHHVTMI